MTNPGASKVVDGFWITDKLGCPFELDPGLRNYATDKEWELLEVLARTGSCRKAAAEHGLHFTAYQKARENVRKKAAQRGYGPPDPPYMTTDKLVPPGQTLRGISEKADSQGRTQEKWTKTKAEGRAPDDPTLTMLPDATVKKVSHMMDSEGNVIIEWVSREPKAVDKANMWQSFADALMEEAPRYEPIPRSNHYNQYDELMACYPIGDHHMGMLAWSKENDGQDYDLAIGERILAAATDYLIEAARPCKHALLPVLGDYFHYDGILPVTPTSGNQLDADSRFPKMIRAGSRTLRYTIDALLRAHETVHVIIEIGNHDIYSSIFMMEFLRNVYEKEPRITIDTSPRHYHYYQFGKVGIMTHHGHGAKIDHLPLIFATDQPQLWADTIYRHIMVGHVHHRQLLEKVAKDHPGVEVETFQVLAPNDSWHSQKGYRSRQSMKCIEFHREQGELNRHTVRPTMIGGLRQDTVTPMVWPIKRDQ